MTRIGLILEDKHVIVLQNDRFIAVRQNGRVELWDVEGDTHFGNLPEDATEGAMEGAYMCWRRGYEYGLRVGRETALQAVRSAIGLVM